MAELEWPAQARSDVVRVVVRLESVLRFQLASALQTALDAFMSPGEQLGALVLLCVCLQWASRLLKYEGEIARGVLVVQVGQTMQGVLVYRDWSSDNLQATALGFLLNTLGLCVPSVLELLNPAFMASDYVQNAISVWLFQCATSTRQLLARVDLGVSPAFVCLLGFALSHSVHARVAASPVGRLYKHVLRAWHMLLVDWLLRTVVTAATGLPQMLQITLLSMVVLIVDELELDSLSLMRDVRGYIVYRIAGELQGLGVLSMDGASALGTALLAFCGHTGLRVLKLHSRATSSAAEVFFVACINVIVQSASRSDDAVLQLLLVGVVGVAAYQVQALLVKKSSE